MPTEPERPSSKEGERGVVWFRRDLRLEDNPAWAAATANHSQVVGLFVLEPRLLANIGDLRRNQLFAHLGALNEELEARGAGLTIRSGPARVAVPRLLADLGPSALYLNRDSSPFGRQRDGTTVAEVHVPVHVFDGNLVHEPGSVLTQKGTLSQVFTPFYKRWNQTKLAPWPEPGRGRPLRLAGDPLPNPAGPVMQVPGNAGAWSRLNVWLERVDDYPATRDLPAIDGTSQLSADLKFGTIGARTVLDAVGESTPGRTAFIRQLAWRDWWAHTLAIRPNLMKSAIRPQYDGIAWHDDDDGFAAWCEGRTGYPIVDAGMRQLVETGWMHNRVRMITASFLVKDLLIDWRRGERFFRAHLIDADIAQNAGNWQWVAGTGPDAAPYFRVFNPTSQGLKFDPEGDFVRRWVPELSAVSTSDIHQPEAAGPLSLASAGVVLGDNYPSPIVDHAAARHRALAAYKKALG